MPIHQVTHINHTADASGPPLDAAEILAKLAAAEVRKPPVFFQKNPKIVAQVAVEVQAEAQQGCNSLDGEGRLAQAAGWKVGANALLAEDRPHAALLGYLVGLWYLRHGPFPMCLAHPIAASKEDDAEFSTASLGSVSSWLGAALVNEMSEEMTDAVVKLRTSLHLNAALAALKLSVWPIARTACERVLAIDETNAKAWFRLAKAHEGEADLAAGLSALSSLIKLEPRNADARRLHDVLRARQAAEKDKFKRLFSGDGGKQE